MDEASDAGIMNEKQIQEFEETMECDFAIALPDGSARFRVNVFRQRGKVGMVLRLIPSNSRLDSATCCEYVNNKCH